MPSQSDWRSTFREWREHEAKPLGLTASKPHQGICGVAQFATGWYPACSEHGAMNRVATAPLWRCLQCNIGVELRTELAEIRQMGAVERHSRLWHDDIRRPPDETWFWARTNRDAVRYLLAGDCHEASLDHDLGLHQMDPDEIIYDLGDLPVQPHQLKGPSPEGNGVDLVHCMLALRLVPPRVTIHSWNPDGANYMAGLLTSLSGADVIVKPFEVPDAA